MTDEIDRSDFNRMARMDRRRFLGALLGVAATASLPLPQGVDADLIEGKWRHYDGVVFVGGSMRVMSADEVAAYREISIRQLQHFRQFAGRLPDSKNCYWAVCHPPDVGAAA